MGEEQKLLSDVFWNSVSPQAADLSRCIVIVDRFINVPSICTALSHSSDGWCAFQFNWLLPGCPMRICSPMHRLFIDADSQLDSMPTAYSQSVVFSARRISGVVAVEM